MGYIKTQRFSYSKLNVFNSCGFKYKLTYVDGHYTFTDSLATLLGSLLHKCEENMARTLQEGKQIDYEKIKDDFLNLNIPKKDKFDNDGGIFGINFLKKQYREEFFAPDEQGASYNTRIVNYLNSGVYRLEKYLKENPNLEVYDMEKYFSVSLHDYILSGYIDRIFHDKVNDYYIIEDIKTKHKPFKDTELTTPLQFVVYVYALSKNLGLPYNKFKCVYDLPFLDQKQEAGTPGFMERGLKKIEEIFNSISQEEYIPKPSPLCAWCSFSPTNPEQPLEGKYLCPYYSLWTKDHKTFEVSHKWYGLDHYEQDIKDEIDKENQKQEPKNESDGENLFDNFDF
jgi:putative RecB family exonuclease